MPMIRTPDERFADLPGFDYAPHYIELRHMRMHYVDEGRGQTILCLHGEPTWSYLYRKMIGPLAARHRVVAPDFIGFGRSDKYTLPEEYTFQMHVDLLGGFLTLLDLREITLVCQDWGGLIGLRVAAEMSERFARLVIMNTGLPTGDEKPSETFLAWRGFVERTPDLPVGFIMQRTLVDGTKVDPRVIAAYEAPFPDASYKVGAAAFPLLVPISPDDPGSPGMRQTREVLSRWQKPALVMFSDGDPITAGGDRWFRRVIPTAQDQPAVVIAGGGHFLQEDRGEEIAEEILKFIDRTPL
ncbi:MAG: haloalkane dehalogenase [Pirellulales bacterium]|nr:haloalkane dehalogenase [Pirellulales bacterium]